MNKIEHRPYHNDGVQILVSQIRVWNPVKKGEYEDSPALDQCLLINECVDIEIEDTYKKLINSAVVKFPRGTIVQRPIINEAGKGRQEKKKDEDLVTYLMTEFTDFGALENRMSGGATATPEDFHVGQRIQIRLGYYEDTYANVRDSYERTKAIHDALHNHPIDFDGYITQCSASSPIEIHCENIASILKRKMCQYVPPRENMKINDLFTPNEKGKNNKFDLLAGTGIKLYPKTEKSNISVGKITIPEGWTIADLLSTWEQEHLYSFIKYEDGQPYLVIGHTYFSGKSNDSIMAVADSGNAAGTLIEFDYDVAKDSLTQMNTDEAFFAVEAQCMTKDEKMYRVTIVLNQDWDGKDPSKKFRIINESNLSNKSMKLMGVTGDKIKHKVDLSLYTVRPYVSSVKGISKEQLIKEAQAYFEGYNRNGVEGKLTIFGDYHLQSCSKVALLDDRNPEKNGWYFVDEVTTNFGVDGFRQTINIPYCIKKEGKEDK